MTKRKTKYQRLAENVENLRQLRRNGLKWQEIARVQEVSPATLSEFLKRFDYRAKFPDDEPCPCLSIVKGMVGKGWLWKEIADRIGFDDPDRLTQWANQRGIYNPRHDRQGNPIVQRHAGRKYEGSYRQSCDQRKSAIRRWLRLGWTWKKIGEKLEIPIGSLRRWGSLNNLQSPYRRRSKKS